MTTQKMFAEGKMINVNEGYTRFVMMDNGRTVREGEIKRYRSRYVWIDDENGVYYLNLMDAYYGEHATEM